MGACSGIVPAMPVAALAALAGVAVLWGSAFPAIKVGLESLSVTHFVLARHLVASAVFVAFLAARRGRMRPRREDIPVFLALGFVGIFVYHWSLTAGELRISAGATSLIIATAPAITAVLATVVLRERYPATLWVGTAVSFVGVALIVLGDGDALEIDPFAGWVVLSAVATATYFVFQQRLFARYAAVEVTAFVTWAGTLPMLAFLPGFPAEVLEASTRTLAATVYVGIGPSAIAYSLFTFAQTRAPVTHVTAMLYAVPVFALSSSWVVLGEVPTALTVVGGIVAIGGIVVVQRARRRAAHARGG